MIFVGVDWAEVHHDAVVRSTRPAWCWAGLGIVEGVEGVARLHALIGEQVDDPVEVAIGIETDRGLLVGALVAAGYQVYAVNPLAVSRYRDRVGVWGAKSVPGDAKVLADLVRTDRHLHRRVAGDSDLAEGIKVMARAHQNAVWSRQRQVNAVRLRRGMRTSRLPWKHSGRRWRVPTRLPFSPLHRRRSSHDSFRRRSWCRCCVAGAGNETLSDVWWRSKRRCAASNSRRHPRCQPCTAR